MALAEVAAVVEFMVAIERVKAAHGHDGCPGFVQDWRKLSPFLDDPATLANLAQLEERGHWCAGCQLSGRDGGALLRSLAADGVDVGALLADIGVQWYRPDTERTPE